jgi:hypothetical protein
MSKKCNINFLNQCHHVSKSIFFVFFLFVAFPLLPLRAYRVPCGRLIFSPLRVRRGSGVLSPATHVHPFYLNQLLQNKTINKKALPEQISFIYFFHFFTYI